MDDHFILEGYNVKTLNVTGYVFGVGYPTNTVADMSGSQGLSFNPSNMNPLAKAALQLAGGRCDISVEGWSKDDGNPVLLKVIASRTIHTNADGSYTATVDMSGLPANEYSISQNDVLVAKVYIGMPTPSPTPVPLSRYTYDLRPGWNLISIPLVLQDNSISGIFPSDVKSKIVTIWGWDESTQNWRYFSEQDHYFDEYFPGLSNLETGKAYWVEMSEPATVVIQGTVPGSAPNSPVSFGSPWSFLGPTGLSSSTPDSMYPNAVSVWGWDQTRQTWEYHSTIDHYFDEYFSGISNIQPGYGYWVEK